MKNLTNAQKASVKKLVSLSDEAFEEEVMNSLGILTDVDDLDKVVSEKSKARLNKLQKKLNEVQPKAKERT